MGVNTYDSITELGLGQTPPSDLDNLDVLYQELLDIHNAIEALLTSTEGDGTSPSAFIIKFRNNTAVNSDYVVLLTDGTVLVDATAGDVLITMHPAIDGVGYTYNIKRIDDVTENTVTIVGDGTELIDDHVGGINLSTRSSYTLKSDSVGYNII